MARKSRLTLGSMPDPARAHGAWVYLISAVLAGVLVGAKSGPLPASLVGIGFAGLFLCSSAFAVGFERGWKRFLIGGALGVAGPGLALRLGADPMFLAYGALAVFPVAASAFFASKNGFLSVQALAFGVMALALAAPSTACAGGVNTTRTLLLVGLLTPFFVWRAIAIRLRLNTGKWKGPALRRAGLREAGYTAAWTVLVIGLVHLV
jgi:hypothetical protein